MCRELHLENCSRLSNAAVRSLAQYKRSDESEEQLGHLTAQSVAEFVDQEERKIAFLDAVQEGMTQLLPRVLLFMRDDIASS